MIADLAGVQAAVASQFAKRGRHFRVVVDIHHVGQLVVTLGRFLLQRDGVGQEGVQVGHALRQFHMLNSCSMASIASAAQSAALPGLNAG